ncbi:MAG: hypothetical protein AAB551_01470 [Patescibacteria group bacterium]
MLQQLPNILTWATIWIVSWGVFFWFMHKKNADYIQHFLLTAIYFLCVAIFTSLIFRDHIVRAIQNFTATPFIVLGFVILAHIILYIYIPKYLREPKEYFEKYPKRQYLKIDKRRLVSKSLDILSQQIFVVLLVMFLQDASLSLHQIIIAFAIIFGLVHAPLIVVERGTWPSWYFTVFSILSAIIFPTLILKVQYGFVYSYIVHWVFYTFTAVGFWLIFPKR